MSKNIHTPRDELICGAIDRAEELVRSGDMVNLMYELVTIRNHAERMEAKLVSRKSEVEAHLMQGREPVAMTLARVRRSNGSWGDWTETTLGKDICKKYGYQFMEVFTAPPAQPAQPDAAAIRDVQAECDIWHSAATRLQREINEGTACAEIRDEAYEKAAQICDGVKTAKRFLSYTECANAIRAMKSKPAEQAPKGE